MDVLLLSFVGLSESGTDHNGLAMVLLVTGSRIY
jgi:hypothetical protein